MSTVDFVCVFARACRRAARSRAERLVLAFPQLFAGALVELRRRVPGRRAVPRRGRSASPETACDAAVRERLAFWAARAGGRASAIAGMAPKDVGAFRANLDACELAVKGVAPANGLRGDRAALHRRGRARARGGARPASGRRWRWTSAGRAGRARATRRATRALFVAAPDRAARRRRARGRRSASPGSPRLVAGKAKVVHVRTPEQAPAGEARGLHARDRRRCRPRSTPRSRRTRPRRPASRPASRRASR